MMEVFGRFAESLPCPRNAIRLFFLPSTRVGTAAPDLDEGLKFLTLIPIPAVKMKLPVEGTGTQNLYLRLAIIPASYHLRR